MTLQRKTYRQRDRRAVRVRNRLKKHSDRPRLCIRRSHKNVYAQIIDDGAGKTLASANTLEEQLCAAAPYGGNKAAAAAVGKILAERALSAGVQEVVFDRREYKYHGRVAALAEAARAAGLKF